MNVLHEELQERLDIITHKLKFIEQRPLVACVVALDPFQLAAGELAQQVATAGGIPIAGDADTLLQLNPDVVILKLTGYNIEQSIALFSRLFELEGFSDLKAVKGNRFYIVDGNKTFDGDAESYVDAVELLAEIIYPKQFIFGYEGQGWIKFNL